MGCLPALRGEVWESWTMPNGDVRHATTDWHRLRLLILDRDRNQCQIRGPRCKQTATEVDHILPPVEGGSFWDPTNLRAACKPCNASLGAAVRAKLPDGDLPGASAVTAS